MTDDERLVWLLGDLMNAVENIFCQPNPKRRGHINSSAISIIDEIIQPLRDRAEAAERERDEWREHHDRADHRAYAYAQQIERLRADAKDTAIALARQAVEIERLREALEQIAEHEMSFGADGYTISARCKDIARAALEAKP